MNEHCPTHERYVYGCHSCFIMSEGELRDKVELLLGTAILKNDKNYTNDIMQEIEKKIKVAEVRGAINQLEKLERIDWSLYGNSSYIDVNDFVIEELKAHKKELLKIANLDKERTL